MDRKFHPLVISSLAVGLPYAKGGGKGDAPDTPDYTAAAQAQGQANLDAARATAKLNNPNVINPYGTQTVTYGGGAPTFDQAGYDAAMRQYQASLSAPSGARSLNGTGLNSVVSGWSAFPGLTYNGAGGFGGSGAGGTIGAPNRDAFYRSSGDPDIATVTQTLSPGEQAVYNSNLKTRQNLGDLGIQGSNSLKDIIGQKIDFSGAPAVGNGAETRQKVYDALMGRVNEDTANSRDQANSDLIARGIRPGTKAYDDAQNLISRQFNDARGVAETNAGNAAAQQFGMDTQARNQYISELLSQRQTPLNEINALMSGSQVNNPFANNLGYQAGANAQAAPVMAGAQAQGQAGINAANLSQSGTNSLLTGAATIGAAFI